MHPQSLQTVELGLVDLKERGIGNNGAHNVTHNINGKKIVFSKIGPIMMSERQRVHDSMIFFICMYKKQVDQKLVQLISWNVLQKSVFRNHGTQTSIELGQKPWRSANLSNKVKNFMTKYP